MTRYGGEALRLTWEGQSDTFKNFHEYIYESSFVADVTLSVNGGTLKAHRLILSMCSTYFMDLFAHHPGSDPILILPDMKLEEMKWLLEFMYLGSVKLYETQIKDLIMVGQKLQIKGLCGENTQCRMDDTHPPRNDTPQEFDVPMTLNPFQHLQKQLLPTSNAMSMLSSALSMNPQFPLPTTLPLANSIPLHSLASLSSLAPPMVMPQMVPSLAPPVMCLKSPLRLASTPISPVSKSSKNRAGCKKRKRKTYEDDGVESDRSSVSPPDIPNNNIIIDAAELRNDFHQSEPTDLTTRHIKLMSHTSEDRMETLENSIKDGHIRKTLPMDYSVSEFGFSRPLVIDNSPQNLPTNGTNTTKKSISPIYTRPFSSHSGGEYRDSGEPSFSSNNSEDSPVQRRMKCPMEGESNDCRDEGLIQNIKSESLHSVVPESRAGPSSVEQPEINTTANFFSALMSCAGMGFMHQPLTAQLLQQSQAYPLHKFENTIPNRNKNNNKNIDRKHICDTCEKTYASSGNLKRHKKYECGVQPQFCCPVCSKFFQHRHSVKLHVLSAHKNETDVLVDMEKNPEKLAISTYATKDIQLTEPAASDITVPAPPLPVQAEAYNG